MGPYTILWKYAWPQMHLVDKGVDGFNFKKIVYGYVFMFWRVSISNQNKQIR
jgi:hypothetical protein